MTGPRRTYTYTCPTCGQPVTVGQAWAARQARPCLACTRAANGWQHQPGCAGGPGHRGACTLERCDVCGETQTEHPRGEWCDAHQPWGAV